MEPVTERATMRKWVQTWKYAGPELELIRLREVRDADNFLTLTLPAPAFEQAARAWPPPESSGLVEMQRLFAKLPR